MVMISASKDPKPVTTDRNSDQKIFSCESSTKENATRERDTIGRNCSFVFQNDYSFFITSFTSYNSVYHF